MAFEAIQLSKREIDFNFMNFVHYSLKYIIEIITFAIF